MNKYLFVLWCCSLFAYSQQQQVDPNPEVVVVTGSFEPIPLSESNRAVVALNTKDQSLLSNSVIDYLHLDASIDMEQRAPDGVQSDISIRGGTFQQSLILLNGLRMNDSQSGHHDMDIPLPLDAISRIEVLHGAGSTLYGADALSGAVNFITAPPSMTELRVRTGFGNFGFNQQRVDLRYLGRGFSEQIAASRDFSTGFEPDRDFRSSALSSETRFKTALGGTDILVAGSDRPFGANQFYGNFNSWERTKSWFASIWQNLGEDTSFAFGYRRHSDEFVLLRDDPAFYENNHVSQSWQSALRSKATVGQSMKLSYGVDADGDIIDSTNLGHHARNRGAGYVNLDLHTLQRLFLSFGMRQELFSGGRTEAAPTFAGAVWLGRGVMLRASASRAFRLPTYTDLYYSDPATIGNPFLKPESAWNFEGGPEWNPGGKISGSLTVFNRRERNDIDYLRNSPTAPWVATNIPYVLFVGIETAVQLRLPMSHEVQLSYTALQSSQQLQPGYTSEYVFNYPHHAAVASWLGQYKNEISFRSRVGATQRGSQNTYAIWDFAVSRSRGMMRPYIQLSNLSNTNYQEIPSVAMPGRSIIAGMEMVFTGRKIL
jgi:outer membrane cobalamin receptor